VISNLLKYRFISKNKGTKDITTSQAYFPKIIGYRAVHRRSLDFVPFINGIRGLFLFDFEVLFSSKKK
jgi:hypothetical protein